MNWIVILLLASSLSAIINAEVYTALVDLAKVFEAEKHINTLIHNYILEEEQRIKELSNLAINIKSAFQLKNVNTSNDDELEKYFSNPVNTYLFTKKFSVDWKDKLNMITQYSEDSYLNDLRDRLFEYDKSIPSDEDVTGAIDALLRLQDTYHLKSANLVNGRINQIQSNFSLSAEDCLKIGTRAYEKNTYYVAINWLNQALELLNENRVENEHNKMSTKVSILDYLIYCNAMIGRYKTSLKLTSEILTVPNLSIWQRIMDNKKIYLEKMSQNPDYNESIPLDNIYESDEDVTYTALCRGENPIKTNPQRTKNLICYTQTNHPFLKIRPLKVEVAFDKPRIWVLHDIIYDLEIAHIKKVATPHLNRATIRNPQTGALETANYRISKSAWLPREFDNVTKRINDRIEIITGLNIDLAEDLQVVNYGIGGHYSPHFDHGRKRPVDEMDLARGQRIATLLYYMSDVEAGGATVFVDAGAQLWPKKGSAAFWYNLKRSGASNDMTRHAACPVLVGSKWVMNKWFRERGQEFTKPCLLHENL